MKSDRHNDSLLNEILANDELEQVRSASLQSALKAASQRRRRRRTGRAVLALALPVIFVAYLFVNRFERASSWENPQTVGASRSAPPEMDARESVEPPPIPVDYISDEELLALFPNRPVALAGKPGEQQLLFLDQIGGEGSDSLH